MQPRTFMYLLFNKGDVITTTYVEDTLPSTQINNDVVDIARLLWRSTRWRDSR
jgi:hypothetical protein